MRDGYGNRIGGERCLNISQRSLLRELLEDAIARLVDRRKEFFRLHADTPLSNAKLMERQLKLDAVESEIKRYSTHLERLEPNDHPS